MRWLRRGAGRAQAQHDPDLQRALLEDVRHRFGGHVQVRFPEQAGEVIRLLDGDDGLAVAAVVVREFADSAHNELFAQVAELHRRTGRGFVVDRRNYRPLWQAAGGHLRWPLFELPVGLHPYVQVAAAVTVLGTQARRTVRVTAPEPLLALIFEILDLVVDGWEHGRVWVDADGAALVHRLIFTARDIRDAMGDPPPLPPPVREQMRRNNSIDVYDPAGSQIVGSINPGKEMREALLA
ncbi:hypothetical protein [Winogradskya humida]|uniref:hypothetical protein n=1 Tax=Winogradskya humida TaxID=113566 RepID=UPI001941DB7E|nr:hypothetical protein [Actinoplanes humidus]